LKKAYIYANGQILAQCDYEQVEPEKYFYVHDRLGSIRLLINDVGDVNNSYTYTPFGEDFATECTETTENRFKFTGQWFDSEIGQYYLRARMYDPVLMRFTSRDSFKGNGDEPLTLNLYLYCINNPINNIDLTGFISAKAIVSDAIRKPYLEHEGRQFEELNRQGMVTGLGAMVTLTDLTAWFYNYAGASRTQFVADLLWMFTERGPDLKETKGNLRLRFDNTGFASRYQDVFPGQVRHFIGCMAAGYLLGFNNGRNAVIAHELGGGEGGFSIADLRLGFRGVDLGVEILGALDETNPNTYFAPIALDDVGDWMLNNLGN
jgi:RHS repeat-associated protein